MIKDKVLEVIRKESAFNLSKKDEEYIKWASELTVEEFRVMLYRIVQDSKTNGEVVNKLGDLIGELMDNKIEDLKAKITSKSIYPHVIK